MGGGAEPGSDPRLALWSRAPLVGQSGHVRTPPNLLSDIAHGDLHCFNGDISLGRLTANNPNVVKGTCFEVRSARHLKEANGKSFLATERLEGKTGFDLFDDAGCFYQCKAYQSSTWTTSKINDLKAWCAKAREASGAADYSKVKIVVPEGSELPQELLKWLRDPDRNIEIIDNVPFQW